MRSLFLVGSFGGLEGVDLLCRFLGVQLDVGGRGATADSPFAGGIRIDPAVFSGRQFHDFVAGFTLLHDDIAASAVEAAPFLGHEGAFCTGFDGLAKH